MEARCPLCGQEEEVVAFGDVFVCTDCIVKATNERSNVLRTQSEAIRHMRKAIDCLLPYIKREVLSREADARNGDDEREDYERILKHYEDAVYARSLAP